MRYLKVFVKDQSANAQADTVTLLFFQRSPQLPDELVRKATAVDISADGLVDYQITGDIDGNGVSDMQDRALLKHFANSALKLGWLSRPSMPNRSINFYVSRFDTAHHPVDIRLDFYQNEKPGLDRERLNLSLTVSDPDGKGVMQLDDDTLPHDQFDTVDRQALQRMINGYLKLGWQ
ncbi:hypothetical protein [Pseudomonas trivialis]|uniref:Uncharacterized protein n=1 Tax=Pseudomonas trivialis TaxID=200450 RepID=A0A0R3A1H0_9PSED|nr:hypothetical protein [Pseudomonas trivialis]KRP63198.1 hypothetical protein TU79_02175 [Pseudomonas trivialis]SDR97280.1 hypothetical protein SAMN04490205_1052 [Pseudomonas trivialis]